VLNGRDTERARAEQPRQALSLVGIGVLTLGALDFGLEGSIIVPALPELAVHYDASPLAAAWLATAFLLGAVVAVPVLSRLGDIHGKRLCLLVSLGAFGVGSLVCALTDSIELAIAGRAVQGLGAAAGPLTVALARDVVPPRDVPRVIGAIMGSASVGGGIGFLLGGVLVDAFTPAAIFWFLAGLAVTLIVAIAAIVPETSVRARVGLDVAGICLLGAGLVALLLAISKGSAWGWSSAAIVGLFVAAAVLLGLFAFVESRVREPHVDLALVRTQPFATVNVCIFAFGFAFFVATYIVPQIAAAPVESGYGLALSTTEIGLLLVPSCIASLLAAYAAGWLNDRVGTRALVTAGAVLGIAGNTFLAFAAESTLSLAAGTAAIGAGWGFILPALYTVVVRQASVDKSAVAASVPAIMRNTGVSVGVTTAFAIVTAAGLSGPFPAESGFTQALLVAAAGAGVVLLASLALPGRERAAAPAAGLRADALRP
jgi:MFS family permease